MNGPTREPFPHGTTNGYGNLGCRCADCRAANTAAHRDYLARRRGRPVVPRPAWTSRSWSSRHPERGRPRDVLQYIDFILEPDRPVMMNLNGGVAEAHRMLPIATAGMWAAQEKIDHAQAVIAAQRKVVEALTELARVA
jgi:hypothetical protein